MPDRVVRQYGRVQGPPLPPIRPKDGKRKASLVGKKPYWTEYWPADMGWHLRHERLYHQLEDLPSTSAAQPGLVTPDYMDWYIPVSHRCILPTTQPLLPPVALPAPDPDAERALLQELRARLLQGGAMTDEERAFLFAHWDL